MTVSEKVRENHLRRALGWKPKRTVEQAIADVVAWWREHQGLAAWSKL